LKENRVRTSLAYKVYIIVVASVAFCALLIGVYYYVESKTLLRENMGRELKKVAQTAALGIDADRLEAATSAES